MIGHPLYAKNKTDIFELQIIKLKCLLRLHR